MKTQHENSGLAKLEPAANKQGVRRGLLVLEQAAPEVPPRSPPSAASSRLHRGEKSPAMGEPFKLLHKYRNKPSELVTPKSRALLLPLCQGNLGKQDCWLTGSPQVLTLIP